MSADALEPKSILELDALKPSHVLVVGTNVETEGVTSVEWTAFPNINIKDYHLVILCPSDGITEGHELQVLHDAAGSIDKDVVDEFLRSPQRELVFVGPSSESGLPIPVYGHISFLHAPRFQSGKNITDVDDEFASFLGGVDTYIWTMPDGIAKPQEHPRMSYRPLARAAGFDVIAGAYQRSRGSGRVVVLPRPTLCSTEEGVVTLLADNYGIDAGPTAPPDWVRNVSLPAVDRLRSEAEEAQRVVGEALGRLQKTNAALDTAEEDLAILYEQGPTLESHVRRILGFLGAKVEEPSEPRGGNDGTLVTPSGDQVVLEIKGRSKNIGLADVRQLDQWVTDLVYADDVAEPAEWKGLLVGNTYLNQSPEDRDAAFAPNAIAFAERRELALVSTSDLIKALVRLQDGKFDPGEWWARVVATNGLLEG